MVHTPDLRPAADSAGACRPSGAFRRGFFLAAACDDLFQCCRSIGELDRIDGEHEHVIDAIKNLSIFGSEQEFVEAPVFRGFQRMVFLTMVGGLAFLSGPGMLAGETNIVSSVRV